MAKHGEAGHFVTVLPISEKGTSHAQIRTHSGIPLPKRPASAPNVTVLEVNYLPDEKKNARSKAEQEFVEPLLWHQDIFSAFRSENFSRFIGLINNSQAQRLAAPQKNVPLAVTVAASASEHELRGK